MPKFWHFKCQNWRLTFLKWTPGAVKRFVLYALQKRFDFYSTHHYFNTERTLENPEH